MGHGWKLALCAGVLVACSERQAEPLDRGATRRADIGDGAMASVHRAVQPRRPIRMPLRRRGKPSVDPSREYQLVVKFDDAAKVRPDEDGFVSHGNRSLAPLNRLVGEERLTFTPLIKLPEARLEAIEKRAQTRSRRAQPDLAGLYSVDLPEPTLDELERVGLRLQELDLVEFASIDALHVPPPGDIPPTTDDFTGSQGYAGSNPGINIRAVHASGIDGTGVRLADIEQAWFLDHEDLVDAGIQVESGHTPYQELDRWHHGTAVLGITSAPDNGYGVTGLVPGAEVFAYYEWSEEEGPRRPTAILAAVEQFDAGDVIIFEMQTPWAGEQDFGPAEFEPAVWMATKVARDAGIIVVAAGGNGGLDLDSSTYQSWSDLGDSGAIIVGAGSPDVSHNAMEFSSYGARVDLQGWGLSVMTTGYGNYVNLDDSEQQMYTNTFAGTSSATPIVASAAVALSQVAKDHAMAAGPGLIRSTLIETGVAQGGGGKIGPLPDVARAVGTWLNDGDDPVVDLAHPADDVVTEEPMYATHIEISATDPTSGIVRVTLEINGEEIEELHDPPFVFENVTFPRGVWTLVAKAQDPLGNLGESQPVTIYVQEDPPPSGSGDGSGPAEDDDAESGGDPGPGGSTSDTGTTSEDDPSLSLARGPQDCRCRVDSPARGGWLALVAFVVLGRRRRPEQRGGTSTPGRGRSIPASEATP